MSSKPLPNYLRTFRKRKGLTQKEVATLMGYKSSAFVCRNERFVSRPTLKTAIAYEIIYRISIPEMFPGLYEDVKKEMEKRSLDRIKRTRKGEPIVELIL